MWLLSALQWHWVEDILEEVGESYSGERAWPLLFAAQILKRWRREHPFALAYSSEGHVTMNAGFVYSVRVGMSALCPLCVGLSSY